MWAENQGTIYSLWESTLPSFVTIKQRGHKYIGWTTLGMKTKWLTLTYDHVENNCIKLGTIKGSKNY